MVVFPPTQLKEIFEASDHLVDACTGKTQLGIGFVAPPPDFHPCIAAVLFYNGSEEEGKKLFEPLYSLKPLADMTSVMPYDKVNAMLVCIAILLTRPNRHLSLPRQLGINISNFKDTNTNFIIE
jgi:hypothetical protein